MIVMGIDPGSQRTGYAVIDSTRGVLVASGAIVPDNRRGQPVERIDNIVDTVLHVLGAHRPAVVVIEVTSGKVARRLPGRISGLSVYGMAVGAIRQAVRGRNGTELVSVAENEWTRGVSKRRRKGQIALAFPEALRARVFDDPDVTDAVGVALYELHRRALAEMR